jgi:RNA polymerase-binding transcription factor DksA
MNERNAVELNYTDAERAELRRYGGLGDSCGLGWLGLVAPILQAIRTHNATIAAKEDRVTLCQIKEKFGGLRFYIDHGTPAIHDLIGKAEAQSFHVCEDCGQPGALRLRQSWWHTLCDSCNGELNR